MPPSHIRGASSSLFECGRHKRVKFTLLFFNISSSVVYFKQMSRAGKNEMDAGCCRDEDNCKFMVLLSTWSGRFHLKKLTTSMLNGRLFLCSKLIHWMTGYALKCSVQQLTTGMLQWLLICYPLARCIAQQPGGLLAWLAPARSAPIRPTLRLLLWPSAGLRGDLPSRQCSFE